jgi:hypothetical protein
MHTPHPPRWQTFRLPKRGHSPDEYEDAAAGDPARGLFAVADGASESSFAALWARLLAEDFVRTGPDDLDGWLADAGRRWREAVGNAPLPWYAEAKREQGAFAAFLGLRVEPGRWRAVAVGDACLFQARGDSLLRSFPLASPDDFGNHPPLLTSAAGASRPWHRGKGKWRPGDVLLLMTDALACWFLGRCAAGGGPWEELHRLDGPDAEGEFADWVEGLRDRDGLRNDDVTLGRLAL